MSSLLSFILAFVCPSRFYLGGFTDIPHVQYLCVFLCFVYIMTVLGNDLLLSVIYLDKTLHTPKYIIVFNLALTDLCGSTAFTPKVVDTFFIAVMLLFICFFIESNNLHGWAN
uniref:G-protein coupled receptors family 1 profile domain-containing protein n=1 Tax=Monopterus albus TaxID=43700 RepID=A0A3Q3IEC9_MONAL